MERQRLRSKDRATQWEIKRRERAESLGINIAEYKATVVCQDSTDSDRQASFCKKKKDTKSCHQVESSTLYFIAVFAFLFFFLTFSSIPFFSSPTSFLSLLYTFFHFPAHLLFFFVSPVIYLLHLPHFLFHPVLFVSIICWTLLHCLSFTLFLPYSSLFFLPVSLPLCLLPLLHLPAPPTFLSLSLLPLSPFSMSLLFLLSLQLFFIAPLPLKPWYPLHRGHISAG